MNSYPSDEGLKELAEFADDMEENTEDWKDVASALRELFSLRQRCAELEQERDAWREDAERLIEHVKFIFEVTDPMGPPAGALEDWKAHNALVAKYLVKKGGRCN